MFLHKNQGFPAHKLVKVGTMLGVDFYEHPVFERDAGLLAHYDGRWFRTGCFELPDEEKTAILLRLHKMMGDDYYTLEGGRKHGAD